MALNRKYSHQRDAILAVMRQTGTHPGARWVHERLRHNIPKLSLGTVYRNLAFFQKEGQAVSIGVVNGEERFDAVTEPHPHLICESCGKVVDLPVPDDGALRCLAKAFARQTGGFTVDYRKTLFCGSCEECAPDDRLSQDKAACYNDV
jgi:Fur family peroxide stress response transcriptional regulator